MVNTDKRIEFLMGKFNVYLPDEIDALKSDMESDGFNIYEVSGDGEDIAFIFKKMKNEDSHFEIVKVYISSNIFAAMLNADPTNNKMYLQWMLTVYRNLLKEDKTIDSAIRFATEDLDMANEYLVLFEGNKRKKLFKELCSTNYATKKMSNPSDITQYSSLSQLYDAIDPFIEKDSTDLMKTMERFVENGQAEIPVRDRNYTVFVPLTRDASVLFNQFAGWCTTTPGNGMFASYTNQSTPISKNSKLYIIIENKFLSGEYENQISLPNHVMYQIHFESKQFRDRSNGPNVDLYDAVLEHSNSLRNYFYDELKPMAKHYKKTGNKTNPYVGYLVSFGYSEILFDLIDKTAPTIKFMNEKIPELPKLDSFSNVMSIFICESGLKEINDTIGKLPNLEILALPNNKLTKIPSSLGYCKKLMFLNISGNQITEVPDSISYLDKSNGGSLEWIAIDKKDLGEEVLNRLKELLPTVHIEDNSLE